MVPPAHAKSFPDFRQALSLHMVETSDTLRALQVKALGATFAPTASYSASRGGGGGGGAKEKAGSAMQLPGGGEAVWHTAIEQVGGLHKQLVIRRGDVVQAEAYPGGCEQRFQTLERRCGRLSSGVVFPSAVVPRTGTEGAQRGCFRRGLPATPRSLRVCHPVVYATPGSAG